MAQYYYAPTFTPGNAPPYIGMDPSEMEGLLGTKLNRQALDKFSGMAQGDGLTPAAAAAMKQQSALGAHALETAQAQAAGQEAGARNALAMKGGLTSGAAERIAKSGANNAVDAAQNARNTTATNMANIGMEDEKTKANMLGQVPGMEMGAANFGQGQQQALYGAKQQQNVGLNAFNANNYDASMKAWAANNQANATQNAGKK